MLLSPFQKGLAVFVILFILGGTIFINHVLLGDVFNKEEAQHAVYGLWLYKDLRALDWAGFWHDTQRQMFWPFFHSWVQAVFFLFFGVSYISARLLSFVIFLITLVLMYAACSRFSEKEGRKIGILACLLALTSPMMLRFSAENTLEGLGALIFLSASYFYTICEERKLTVEYAFLAVLLGLSLYTNYLYAYLMIPAFIVMTLGKLGPISVEVIKLNREGEKAAVPFFWWAYRKLVVVVVLALFIAAWFFSAAFSRKIMLFLQAIFRYSGGEPVSGFWQTLFYYPQVIIENYTFSPWLGILMVVSLFMPFVAFRFRQVGRLYTFTWTAIILATLTVPTKAPQFIYIIAPFLFIVFSATVFYWLEKINRKYAASILIIAALPALLSFPRLWEAYFPTRPVENMAGVLNYFRQMVLPRYPVAIAVNLKHLNPEEVAFHFWDWNAPVLSDPTIGEDEMFRSARYFLAVEFDPESPYRSEVLDDSIYRWNVFLSEKLKSQEIREFSLRRFESLGLTARIFEKQAR